MDRFDICWPHTLIEECPLPEQWSSPRNFSNDAHDPGGATMCGITQREYSVWRVRHGLPSQNVRLISREEGRTIYYNDYWLPNSPKLPAGLDLGYFDECVNAGPHAATMLLQETLDIESDGLWGPHTDAAVKAIQHPKDLVRDYMARRRVYYRGLRGFQYFGRDWLARAVRIGDAGMAMAAA